jgi:hypothetical protein
MKTDMKCMWLIDAMITSIIIVIFAQLLSYNWLTLYFGFSEYQLSVRQQPKQSRMCGIGEKGE